MADERPTIRQRIHLPPSDTARAFDARERLRTTARWSEMWHADHARAFTVAKVAQLDLLETIRTSLADAVHNGATFEQWSSRLIPDLQRAGWWGRVQDAELTGVDHAVNVGPRRLRTIYDTNLRVSRAAGLWARIQDRKDVAPYLRYSAIMDSRTRPLHRAWHGVILPVDHPFWQTHFPPNGWNCRCTVIQLTGRQLEASGWKVTPDADLLRIEKLFGGRPTRFQRATGEIVTAPPGIDPGFAYNPGNASFRAVAEKATQTLAAVAQRDPLEAIDQLAGLARGAAAMRVVHTMGQAGEESIEQVRGFTRQIATDEVRHALNTHGSDEVPLLASDFRLIPEIVRVGQRVVERRRHDTNQVFWVQIGDVYYIYAERIGGKQKRILARTLFKTRELPQNLRGGGR